MSDQGFGRNVRAIFGSNDYIGMADSPIASVSVSDDKKFLTFLFQNDSKVVFEAEGDCCSDSWIEHLTVPDDIAGATLTGVTDERLSRDDGSDENSYTCIQVYQTKFRSPKGDIIVEYRNSSNGYYGGYLTRVQG